MSEGHGVDVRPARLRQGKVGHDRRPTLGVVERTVRDDWNGLHFAVNIFVATTFLWLLLRSWADLNPIWAISSMVAASDPVVKQAAKTFRGRIVNSLVGSAAGCSCSSSGTVGWKLPIAMSAAVPGDLHRAPADDVPPGADHRGDRHCRRARSTPRSGPELGCAGSAKSCSSCVVGILVSWGMSKLWPMPEQTLREAFDGTRVQALGPPAGRAQPDANAHGRLARMSRRDVSALPPDTADVPRCLVVLRGDARLRGTHDRGAGADSSGVGQKGTPRRTVTNCLVNFQPLGFSFINTARRTVHEVRASRRHCCSPLVHAVGVRLCNRPTTRVAKGHTCQQLSTASSRGEVASDQVHQIQQLQGLVRVTLANGILFPEGGWELDARAAGHDRQTRADLEDADRADDPCQGYTDNVPIGSGPELRQRFPDQRRPVQGAAQSVANELTAGGVPASMISVMGFGDADPVAPNDTPQGRAKNRRVVMDIVESQ